MGNLAAMDMLNHTSMDTALYWHLTANHFPSIPTSMVAPCKRAIEKAARGQWDKKVRLPEGVTYRGEKLAPVSAMVEQHHLDHFVERRAVELGYEVGLT